MKSVSKLLIVPLFAALAASCATPVTRPAPLTGSWGGQHVGLVLTGQGGTLDYDCAAGRIDGPVIPQPDGSFEALGTHTPGTGGPERVGEVRAAYPATYSGQVSGGTMTLTVDAQLPSGPTRIGPYTLRFGEDPRLLRCL